MLAGMLNLFPLTNKEACVFMGKQIRFFMLPEEEKKFIDIVLAQKDLLVRPKFKDGNMDLIRDSLNISDYKLYIVTKQSRIVCRSTGFISETLSDAIEFLRCKIDNHKLEYGRLWVEMKYWDEKGQLITKDKQLNKRFEFYRKWIKENYRISKDKGFYIGDEAYKLYREGKLKMISPINYVVEFN